MTRTIDLEAHFATEEWVAAMYGNKGHPKFVDDPATGRRRLYYWPDTYEPAGERLFNRLLDLGSGRIEAMDAAGIDLAVVSLVAPGVDQFPASVGTRLARNANDELAVAIDRHPGRFAGFAALAPKDPEAAACELERVVKELGFKGWKAHSNLGDSYLDDKRYWPILAKAEELGTPVYLHPTSPMIPELRTYGLALGGAGFGFGVETAAAMMRLVLSGVFDAFPELMVILGHYGEGLAFQMQRVDHAFVRPHIKASDPDVVPDLRHRPSDYLRDNMLVTTSGNYLPAAFECTRQALGIDRILLATDYPFEEMDECLAFLENLDLTRDEKAKIYFGNAERLGLVTSAEDGG